MADTADLSDAEVANQLARALARTGKPTDTNNINPEMRCIHCDEPTESTNHRWCTTECRADWESNLAKRKNSALTLDD